MSRPPRLCASMARPSICRIASPADATRGFSLIECLIATALAMSLIASVSNGLAELLAATGEMVAKSDLMLRARNINRFLADTSKRAWLPETSLSVADAPQDAGVAIWTALSDPCIDPGKLGERRHWGGINILNLEALECIAGSGPGLYIERVLPCPEFCGSGSGWVLTGPNCDSPFDMAASQPLWRARWQANMGLPSECAIGTVWGRLDRLVLRVGQSSYSNSGVPSLRLSQMSNDYPYRWQPFESLVDGVATWRLQPVRQHPDQSAASAYSVIFTLDEMLWGWRDAGSGRVFSRLLVPQPTG